MSITSRIASMEEHISGAYDELQGLGADLTNVDKNIENISSVLDTIYDSMPQVSGEGTSVSLDNTRVGKIKSTLKGNTSQNGTPTPDTPIPVNVVSGDNTIKISDIQWEHINGYISLSAGNGKFTTDTDDSIYFPVVQGHTYTFNLIGNRNRSAIFDSIPTNNKYAISGTYVSDLTSPYTATATGYMVIYINTPHSQSIVDSFYVYEYGYNTYPINLPVENLFDKDTATYKNGYIINDSGVEQSSSLSGYLTTYIQVQSNTQYTLKGTLATSGNTYAVYYYDSSKQWISRDKNLSGNAYTFTTPLNCSYIQFQYNRNNYDASTIQISKGQPTTNFYPYGTTPIELCKIGDYQDYFLHDKTLDKWYLHKEIGKYIFNGTENFANVYSRIYNNMCLYSYGGLTELVGYVNFGYTNRFGYSSVFDEYHGEIFTIRNNKSIGFALSSDKCPNYTTAEIQAWFSNNNTTMYYGLATSTNTEITYQPLIDQLNNIEKAVSYNGQTNISQVNNDKPFIISASALKEWQESNVSTLSMVNPLSLGNTLNTQENDIQPLEINEKIQPIEVDNIEPLEEENYEENQESI